MIQNENGCIKEGFLSTSSLFFFSIFKEKVKSQVLAFLEELNSKF